MTCLRLVKLFWNVFSKGKFIWYDKGGWRYWNAKLEILAAPLPLTSSSIFRSPPPVGFEVCKFSEPPLLAQQFFQSPPFGCLKIFAPPLNIFTPPPFILNELSLISIFIDLLKEISTFCTNIGAYTYHQSPGVNDHYLFSNSLTIPVSPSIKLKSPIMFLSSHHESITQLICNISVMTHLLVFTVWNLVCNYTIAILDWGKALWPVRLSSWSSKLFYVKVTTEYSW